MASFLLLFPLLPTTTSYRTGTIFQFEMCQLAPRHPVYISTRGVIWNLDSNLIKAIAKLAQLKVCSNFYTSQHDPPSIIKDNWSVTASQSLLHTSSIQYAQYKIVFVVVVRSTQQQPKSASKFERERSSEITGVYIEVDWYVMHSKKFNKPFNIITGSNICSECNELARSAKFYILQVRWTVFAALIEQSVASAILPSKLMKLNFIICKLIKPKFDIHYNTLFGMGGGELAPHYIIPLSHTVYGQSVVLESNMSVDPYERDVMLWLMEIFFFVCAYPRPKSWQQ